MTHSEAAAHAEGIAEFVKNKFPPAEAMLILTILNARLLIAGTPNRPGAMDKSVGLFVDGIIAEINRAVLSGVLPQ